MSGPQHETNTRIVFFTCIRVITKLHKVIILEYIFDGVIRVQQTQTLAPSHHEASVLHGCDAAVVWLVLDVALQRLVAEPPDGVGGVSAWHRQPLISDVDSKTRHCAFCGSLQQCALRAAPRGITFGRAQLCHQSDAPLGSPASPASHLQWTTDLHRSVTRMFGHTDLDAFRWCND